LKLTDELIEQLARAALEMVEKQKEKGKSCTSKPEIV
jgi:hypothetical protein